MDSKRLKFSRFKDQSSEPSLSSGQNYDFEHGLYLRNFRTTVGRVLERLGEGFERGSERIKSFKKPKSIPYVGDQPKKEAGPPPKTILDPQGQFLQTWNKVFVLSCVISVALDPLFFYIPIIRESEMGENDEFKCLGTDERLAKIASFLRSLFDAFYVIHIIFQFRTGFIAPSSQVFGRGETITDPVAIAKRYLSTYFLIDILSILPLPQVVSLVFIAKSKSRAMKRRLKFAIFSQYVPRITRLYPLYMEVKRTSGILTQTAWAGAAYNLFLYMLASHVVGAFWYLFAIERVGTCWQKYCNNSTACEHKYLYCEESKSLTSVFENCPYKKPDEIENLMDFNFGMFTDALKSGMRYLQSTTMRVEEMRVKRTDAEQWMSHRMLPEELRARVRRYQQYKWQLTRGVEEENLLQSLPKDLKRDITRHLCLNLLKSVPMFEKMDSQLFDALCDRLKPVLHTEKSCIILEGDPVDEMLFIMRGTLTTMTEKTGNAGDLKAGDFCGEELFAWALNPRSSTSLPISTRTVIAQTEVEAFALRAADLKFVASQFRRLHSKQFQHIFRFYSLQWKTWASRRIQAVWRRYYERKLYKSLHEAEDTMQDAVIDEAGTSKVEQTDERKAPKRLLLLPQKPDEPNYNGEDY
nr:cyclic nucleotide-gated ion channel 1 [Quercus suber]